MTATDLLLTVLVLGVTVIAISVDVGAAVDLARRWAMKKSADDAGEERRGVMKPTRGIKVESAMTYWPTITTRCADCGVGTITLGECYMVHDHVWEQAWAGRRKSWHGKVPGQEILCIGCLEKRIGRTLMACDFIPDVPTNEPDKNFMSERLLDRVTTKQGSMSGEALFDYLVWRTIKLLPENKREGAWRAWKDGARDD